ncbi:hypothetical protein P0W64_16475 [Tsukamurella sp. 8F]|uniref:hypothetical protein n=1 Tax=unclassified Tsukamurella TaxID=2633480 RepID=UPI0023B9DF55|nr:MULTISPECIES: hypothetical protein [unclassified Tsukamurella]MDF0531131.1 hypothetical protein [Tsukamurella sp. 8J]MDF0588377.1 hypothetical protein [Tsukamurella sp. 8F]
MSYPDPTSQQSPGSPPPLMQPPQAPGPGHFPQRPGSSWRGPAVAAGVGVAVILSIAALILAITGRNTPSASAAAPSSIEFSPPSMPSTPTGIISPYVNETPQQAKAALCTGDLFNTIAAVTAAGRAEKQNNPQRYLTIYSTLEIAAALHPNAPQGVLDGYRKYAIANLQAGTAGGDAQQAASDQITAACK